MTDIDPKALEHACQCAGRSVHHFDRMGLDLPLRASIVAHARAIEQHEAFKREVSKAITDLTYIQHKYTFARGEVMGHLEKFVLKEPADPLVEALDDLKDGRAGPTTQSYAACLRAAIEARGGRIVWEGE